MASDFFRYEGRIGEYEVKIDFIDTNGRIHYSGLWNVQIKNSEGKFCDVNKEDPRFWIIRKATKKRKYKLAYLGGWCASGSSWGPDGVRHCYEDDKRQ